MGQNVTSEKTPEELVKKDNQSGPEKKDDTVKDAKQPEGKAPGQPTTTTQSTMIEKRDESPAPSTRAATSSKSVLLRGTTNKSLIISMAPSTTAGEGEVLTVEVKEGKRK